MRDAPKGQKWRLTHRDLTDPEGDLQCELFDDLDEALDRRIDLLTSGCAVTPPIPATIH